MSASTKCIFFCRTYFVCLCGVPMSWVLVAYGRLAVVLLLHYPISTPQVACWFVRSCNPVSGYGLSDGGGGGGGGRGGGQGSARPKVKWEVKNEEENKRIMDDLLRDDVNFVAVFLLSLSLFDNQDHVDYNSFIIYV